MSKKPKKSVFRIELGRAALVVVFASALGFAVNAYSARPLSIFAAPAPDTPGAPAGPAQISVRELSAAMKANDAVLIVDVRDEPQFEIGHVPGSLHAPLDSILNQDRNVMSVIDAASKSGALIVTLCDSEQCSKAGQAAETLLKFGHPKVRVLFGGWEAYFHSGQPVEEGAHR